ncbi:neuraminidase-like domain-containing protein [Bacillus thuringiensis]|uniref:Tc toxin subunit A-related protein n=1 Tax=Bacillus thuringiensis TaxID=1428 RepID=UPI000BFE2ECC|nr:neuraminidase-like domain-containing protein [Bacillus thuringiensis]PGT56989.1 hypothetical protein COD16_25990 [Bacillus thuringiensis]
MENRRLSNKINFFKFDLNSDKKLNVFETIYQKNNGNWSAIKAELIGKQGFTPQIINNLEFTHQLAEWSNNNQSLISVFKKDEQIHSMFDIAAKFTKAAFIEKVKDTTPEETGEEKKNIALNMYRKLFNMEPTAMLINMIKGPQATLLNNVIGANVAAVLEKNPDFNIKTTSIYEVINNEEALKDIPLENQETVITQLKTLQRITAVSPDPDALPVLYNTNLHSAMQISDMPRKQFITRLSKSGLDDDTLSQIHNNAQQARVRNEQAIMSLREAYKGTGLAMIDKSMNVAAPATNGAMTLAVDANRDTALYTLKETLDKHHLSWDLLFGDADFCECGECTSVYSAAAYYVELLQYLRNNNLDPNPNNPIPINKLNPKDISGTPLEKLFDRRPDLGCLELTCENTNTILPYIDLVNEVMENYVAFKHPKPFNVEDEASSELLAEPQHTEYQAYCILKNEVYPFTLPYHQPIDAERIYLNHLDTSRYELIKTFRKNNASNDAELTRLKDDALDRAADAEFLGITMEEYVILTKECFESKALMDKLKNKIHTDEEYRKIIGVKPVCKYYGFDDDNTMRGDDGLTLIKKEFLLRTGIDYFNLVDLLKTRYINPYMPKGKSKTIMESLHFSYRFLQNYAKAYGIDKMAEDLVKGEKLAELVPFLKEQIDLLTNKKALSCPNSDRDAAEICEKDIIHWVKCQFEKVGKMIVIESGRGCVNGKIIRTNEELAMMHRGDIIVEDCKIFVYEREKKKEIGSIDKKTGEVSFKDTNAHIDESVFKELSFIGEKGEKGVFLVIDHKIYLVFLEQKDSCNLDTALLQHLDGTPLTVEEYDKIHRFIRLWRKLGWTIDETDQAIAGLSKVKTGDSPLRDDIGESFCEHCGEDDCHDGDCDDCEEDTVTLGLDINPNLIHQLVAVKKLLDKTGLELIKLLTFWSDISTAGEKSLYQQLFLIHNVLGIDKIFKADDKGNYLTADVKLLEHVPVVMASLNLSADDIQAIMQDAKMEDKLTLSNLSNLYRYRLLSKVLGLRIPAFVSILLLFKNIFQSAHATLEFMENWEKMEGSGFTYQQLNYIINDVDDEKRPFAPTKLNILLLSKTLYDGLNAIDEEHKDLIADSSITDPALQKINIQEKATSALIRTKTSLLFETDTVEKIIGILEGTNVYTNNAPKNLDFTLLDTGTLKKKLKYDKALGFIQITGILSESEVAEYKAISNSPEWIKALTCIQKQQDKLFKEFLSGIFENVQAKTKVEKEEVEKIIKLGDIIIPLDKITEGQEDSNTAPQKRVAFLEIFLPYLRQQLTHRFVIDTLANLTGLDAKTTDLLVSDVLKKVGSTDTPIYGNFEKIKESSKPDEANWSGYLIPAADTNYTFIMKKSVTKPSVLIDGVVLDFPDSENPPNECQDDQDKEWWSETKQLQAGKLYKIAVTSVEPKNIFWKTPTSAITVIPSSALIPDFASDECGPALTVLKKAAILVSNFNLSVDEIRFFKQHKTDFDNLDFNALQFSQWLRLEAYIRLRNSLPQSKLNILEFWYWIYEPASDEKKLIDKIVELTTWKNDRIQKLVAANHFNIGKLEDFRNEKNLLKLEQALMVADRIGIDIDLLFEWAVPVSKFNICRKIADSIKNAIQAKYNQTDWEQVVKPLHDQLRNNQKEALIGYLLQQKELIAWNVTDADGLFEYFLIDVQMDACMETSRIKQAISSVQLFVQRCFLGLEKEHNNITANILDRQRWDWMQRYRVWEANRKVFLYPENWIESNLRDDKSPFFKELESELLQKDINKQNVTDALKSYLYKVDEVANMEVVGLYIDGTRTGIQNGKISWNKENPKMHVFSRTRNAPYRFYYRHLDLDEMNWYPWEIMQIDIPSYDVEYMEEVDDPAHPGQKIEVQVKGNGCYLTPVVLNDERLLVFFPEIIKKTKPNTAPTGTTFRDLADKEIQNSIEYFEIKMAWSEYRNGKWTQKQLSNNVLIINIIPGRRIDQFSFIPQKTNNNIMIYIEDQVFDDTATFKGFTFTGSIFEDDKEAYKVETTLPSSIKTEFGTTVFQKFYKDIQSLNNNSLKIQSLQLTSNTWGNDDATFTVDRNTVQLDYLNQSWEFYDSNSPNEMNLISSSQLDEFFNYNQSISPVYFGEIYENNYHELKHPYSLYNWELFFHTPIILADALSKSQKFEEAMKWFHFVFNPIADGIGLPDSKMDKRFWQFKPFQEIDSQRILDSIFNNLKPNTAADETINEWRNKPFMPHVVARRRPVAYMKWVVMKYIDNLLAWGDYLFRQDTIETINQATQLYVLAGHILGPRPMMIPKRDKIKPQTYLGLLDKWDAFGNAMVELELAAPFSNQTTLPFGMVKDKLAFANIFGFASSLYFCIPNNPKLMGYWDTLADRLYKIRHCQNIEGVFRKLPLFEPPIDPALLVKAAAQGLSIESVLNDLNTPMPNYRFYYLLQKALELCNELKSLGGAMLSAIEKKDNETITLIRAKHEGVMQNLVMEIKKKQLEEAQKNIESLMQNRKTPEARMKYYLKLSGLDESLIPTDMADFNGIPNEIVTVDGDSGLKLIPFEKEDMEKASEAQDWQRGIGIVETLASVLHIIPSFEAKAEPFGIGMSSVITSGWMLGNAAQAVARGLQVHASDLSFASSNAGKKGGFTRALQERIFQANAAGYELKQIDKQITAQEIRIDLANQEITNQQQAIDNANEVEEFIKNKYSNEELYTWMRGSLKTLYHQVYNLAYELAKKAEKTYCFERGISSSNFIQSGYFDAGRDGLLAGEQLYVGLKQLEAAYQNERGHEYEITKHLSLYQINPLAIIQLRETSKCEFAVPEVLFDMDYPGHYKRRIKSVSVSIPCIVGPYTGINATLSLLENKFRNTAIGGKTYEEDTEETDARFSSYNIPIKAIAASSAQNDSGMFELNFKDERYLPFEGAGVISKWRLELPKFKQFDYNSISDVIIHLKYTACEGGERLKFNAINSIKKQLDSIEQELNETGLHVVLNMKHDLPNEWHLLKKNGTVELKIDKSRLPYMVQTLDVKIENVMFLAKVKDNPVPFSVKVGDNTTNLDIIDEWKLCGGNNSDIELDKSFELSVDPTPLNILEELMLVVKYSFKNVSGH